MLDNVPVEIRTEIIKRIPVKSLIRYRSVSKPWKSFIDSSEFIAGYCARKTQPHSLLLRYKDNSDEVKYASVNNDTVRVQQDLAPNVSDLMKQFNDLQVIGYSRGLLCFYTMNKGGMFVLWNPSIRRSVGIAAPSSFGTFGFAVCPVTNEPTIVKIISYSPWKVEIFTLSSKKWTAIQCHKPRESIAPGYSQVVIGSCIYRVASKDVSLPNQFMIVSFDLIAKEFKPIHLPDKITNLTSPVLVKISKLKGSLVVTVLDAEVKPVKVWKMEPDCSFTHLFTINTPDSYISNIVGFRKNGELLVETQERRGWLWFYGMTKESALAVYDPCSHHINNLGFSGQIHSFFISSYKETLHLLDHSDSCVYPEIN